MPDPIESHLKSELSAMLAAGRVPLGAPCTLAAMADALHPATYSRVHIAFYKLETKRIGFSAGAEVFALAA